MNDVARSDGLPYLEQARAFRPRIDREGIRIAQSDGQILRGIRRKEPRRQVIPAARRHRHTAHAGAEDGECRRSAKDDERCKSIHCPPSRPRLLRRPASRSCRAGGLAGSGAPPDRRALPA